MMNAIDKNKEVIYTMLQKRTMIVVISMIIWSIMVSPSGSPALEKEIKDEDISLALRQQLINDEMVSSHLIDIKTIDGIVTLSGTITNWTEYYAAIENAFEGGATDVQSYLKVKDSPMFGEDPTYYDNPPNW
jgi:hypothetical protein